MAKASFDGHGYCRSCGYKRERAPDASCRWPEKHGAGTEFVRNVISLYVDHRLSMTDVGVRTGISSNRVLKILKDHGVPRRTLSEAVAPNKSKWRFGRDASCLSCGRKRDRPPNAQCEWPDKHTRQRDPFDRWTLSGGGAACPDCGETVEVPQVDWPPTVGQLKAKADTHRCP